MTSVQAPTTVSPAANPMEPRPRRTRRRKVTVLGVLRELWRARDLVGEFFKRDITVRYTQAIMGFAWALLMPLLIVGSGLIFRVVVSVLSGTELDAASVASLAVKAMPWAFFSGALSIATQSVLAHANLIGKMYFPREALPVASVLAQGVDFLIGGVALLLVLPLLGVSLTWAALWAPVVLFLLLLFTIGCALLLSCANLFFRDVKYITQVTLNFGIFATPVFFEPQMLGPKGARILMAVPLSSFIQGIDVAVVRGANLLHPVVLPATAGPVTVWSPWMLGYMATLAVLTCLLGVRVFRSMSSRFAEMA
jgi:ABC-type polysaccharide/polyol phosphate export permease